MPKSKIHAKRRNKRIKKSVYSRNSVALRDNDVKDAIASLSDESIPSEERRKMKDKYYDTNGNIRQEHTRIVKKDFKYPQRKS